MENTYDTQKRAKGRAKERKSERARMKEKD